MLLNNNVKIYRSVTTSYSGGGAMMGSGGVMMPMVGYSSSDTKYFYGEDPDHVTRLEKKNFIDIMSELLAGKPHVVKRVKDKTFKIGKIDELLYFYRTDNYPQTMSPPKN